MTMIMPMIADDIEATVAALKEYAAEMGYPFNPVHVLRLLSARLDDVNWFFMVAKDEDGRIVASSVMVIVPSLYDPTRMEGREVVWHSDPRICAAIRVKLMLRLLDLMVETCRQRGVVLHMSVPAGNPGRTVARMLETRGLKKTELFYVKEIV